MDEDFGEGRLGLAFGELELGVLEFQDRPAESLALLDVIDSLMERALHCSDDLHRDLHTFLGQLLHQMY